MDWSIKKNRNYLLWILVFCALIPHAVLILLEMEYAAEPMGLATQESNSKFFVCEWAPLFAVIIAYLRMQKRDNFSLLPVLCFGLIVPTLLYRFDQLREIFRISTGIETNAIAIVWNIPVMLLMECTGLLGKLESSPNKALAGIAADRGMLRAFLFWAVVSPCLSIISCEACAYYGRSLHPWALIEIPAVVLFAVFRYQKERAPTHWSVMAMLLIALGSLLLTAAGPMEMYWEIHFTIILSGHVIVFLMLFVYHLDHWIKQKAAGERLQ